MILCLKKIKMLWQKSKKILKIKVLSWYLMLIQSVLKIMHLVRQYTQRKVAMKQTRYC
ncbi:Uncharacterised protein [Mycobacteroides abscessus subsp. massiliense]|nr:Uncharacterised protein [Mycobacteroides abscessus subsp. massiliense]